LWAKALVTDQKVMAKLSSSVFPKASSGI